MSARTRLLVLGSVRDAAVNPFDGIVVRHLALLQRLAVDRRFDVDLLLLSDPSDDLEVVDDLRQLARVLVHPTSSSPGRRERGVLAARRAGLLPPARADGVILDAVAERAPDVGLTLSPFLEAQFASLWRTTPTVHMFEEDVWARPDLGATSRAGRALLGVERLASRISSVQPRSVVSITGLEAARARKRFRTASEAVLPLTLPEHEGWPQRDLKGDEDLLVMGVLTDERNAGGLREFLSALGPDSGIPVRLVSDRGLHPSLEELVDDRLVRHVPSSHPAWQNYADARLCLVPARHVTGIKSTMLQAWTCGVPVLTYDESVRPLTAKQRVAVVHAGDPEALVHEAQRLWRDPSARDHLTIAGLRLMREDFDADRTYESLVALLEDAAARAGHET